MTAKFVNPQRRLGHRQMAFVRCWAEGLDLAQAWDRYLYVDGAADARRASSELQRLLDQLRGLARVHGRPQVAALLRRDPQAIADKGSGVPSLDEYRAKLPADFYSEAELVELHRAEFGAADARSPVRRRQRLRERLVLAVQWLDRLAARDPQPGDALAQWLDERVALRLAAAGLTDIATLLAWIAARGFNWQRGIAGIGPERAARILRWLGEHDATLGPLPRPALRPRSMIDTQALTPAPRTGIVPLERFCAPSGLDGSLGSNRVPLSRCKLSAANDHEAINAWLRLRIAGGHTWRAYRKEAERFLLWAVLARGRALSSLDGDDCVAYREFLTTPGTAWCGARHLQRWSEAWRPFEGPLSARSAATAITIVRTLCEWLVRRNYLDTNPWDDVPQRPDAPSMPSLRALSARQWAAVQAWSEDSSALPPLMNPPANSAANPGAKSLANAQAEARRLRFMLRLAYTSGMRLSELANARVAWFTHEALDDGQWVWSLMVLGKRAKWREVPLPDSTVEGFRDYLADRGLSTDILANPPDTPLIAHLQRNAALSTVRIHELLSGAFERCAAWLANTDPRAAQRIAQATTHWLRHTYGSHAAAAGVPQDVLQATLGHQSPATTAIYLKAEKGRKHRAIAAAFGDKVSAAE